MGTVSIVRGSAARRAGGLAGVTAVAVVALASAFVPSVESGARGRISAAHPAIPATFSVATVVGKVPHWLLGHDWERIPTKKHVVALTFDAGSDAAGLPSIRHTLSTRDVPATFFLTGQWARQYPIKAKAVAARYRVGNHSMTHPHFTDLSNKQIRSQLTRAARAIQNNSGVSPRPLFRFPYGDRNKRTIAAVNNAGYVAVRWTVDTLGWEGTGSGITVKSIVRRVLAGLVPGEIVLMHVGANPDDHSTLDADALPQVIRKLRAHGYDFVTLDALLTARK
jgi:peptidoglycan-N-acetylglucosamine deacetylase